MSRFERPTIPGWGLHPLSEAVTKWPRPDLAKPQPDFTYGPEDDPAPHHRQVAAAHLIFLSVQVGQWMGASWPRIAMSVLEMTDADRFRLAVRRWRMWRIVTLGISVWFRPFPDGITAEIPPHSGGTLTSIKRTHWAGYHLQEVADGLHEMVRDGILTRSDQREHAPVFFPQKPLVDLLARYRSHLTLFQGGQRSS